MSNNENHNFLKAYHYFVDEAGTPEIWGRRRKNILIGEKTSKYFMIGLADIREVSVAANALDNLRAIFLNDPEFAHIKSLHPGKKKTARQFHAKDDHPKIRERVFSLLCRQEYDIRFYAVVRNKQAVLDTIKRMKSIDSSYYHKSNYLYDALVQRLFSGRLHFDNSRYKVYFAQRGKTPRQKALTNALHKAQRDYEEFASMPEKKPKIQFVSGFPHEYEGLQMVDYFCWALQRLYERDDNHYWKRLWQAGKIRCVVDMDENEIYSKDNPLLGELRI